MSSLKSRPTAKQLPQEAHKAIMEHGKLEIGDKKLRITRSEAPRAI
jgi:5-carboxymethyl-2-hydroxymuconate isomerase